MSVLVSVIIPTFNRFEAVQNAIHSVLVQSVQDLEVIVIDDCSTDDRYLTLSTLYEHDPRVTVLRLPENMRAKHNSKAAQGLTRNEGIKIAKGKYIALLDDDDVYAHPDKLAIQLSYLQQYPEYKWSSTNAIKGHGMYPNPSYHLPYFQYPIGKPIVELYNDPNVPTYLRTIYEIDEALLLTANFCMNSSSLIAADVVEQIGLQRLVDSEDYDWWKRAVKHTKLLYISTPLIAYDMGHAGGKQYEYKE
jgi:glycosyltransferase involved in cell wall biosynthesis